MEQIRYECYFSYHTVGTSAKSPYPLMHQQPREAVHQPSLSIFRLKEIAINICNVPWYVHIRKQLCKGSLFC